MRYHEFSPPASPAHNTTLHKLREKVRAAHAERIWPEIGNPTEEQRTEMRHVVEVPGLTVHDLGPVFAEEFQGRRLWCRKNCRGVFFVEPIRDARLGRDTGRRFVFAEPAEAAMFRLTWG